MKFEKKLIYTAHSHNTKDKCGQIVRFVLSQGYLPLDPFTVFPSDILDNLKLKKFERLALDMKLLHYADELWVFGTVTYGVSKEIEWWKKNKSEPIMWISWEKLWHETR